MKHVAATVLAFGAAVVFATPASAASTVYLASNFQPVTISVNGKGVSVNDGYDWTAASVSSDNVSLSAPAKASLGGGVCGNFSSWSDGNSSRTRTVNLKQGNYFQVYYIRGAC